MQRVATISYRHIRQIGVGQGMNSEVFLAEEPQIAGVVAVKEIPKARLGNTFDEYFNEARAMFASAHSNVVPIQYACELTDKVCLVMPFFTNGSLADRISQSPVRPREAIRVGQGILSGLAKIHTEGRIHFDVKPSNVLFSDSNTPMVADFGQARKMTATGVANVPPVYPYAMPPEFFRLGVGTVQSDIYQVGLTLYRAVNGNQFFKQQIPTDRGVLQQMTIDGKFPDRSKYLPHVPRGVRRVIRKAMQPDAKDRYASAPDFADALARIDLAIDWDSTVDGNGEIEWRGHRDSRPTLCVKLLQDGSRWKYELHTHNGTHIRAKARDQWRDGLTRNQAFASLKQLFEVL